MKREFLPNRDLDKRPPRLSLNGKRVKVPLPDDTREYLRVGAAQGQLICLIAGGAAERYWRTIAKGLRDAKLVGFRLGKHECYDGMTYLAIHTDKPELARDQLKMFSFVVGFRTTAPEVSRACGAGELAKPKSLRVENDLSGKTMAERDKILLAEIADEQNQ